MMLFFRTYTCIFITLNSFLWRCCLYSLQWPYSVTGVSKTQLPCINLLPWQGCLDSTCTLFIWHTHTTWHCFQIALLWHCTGPTDCPVAQGIVLILSRLLLFVNNVVWLYIGRNIHPCICRRWTLGLCWCNCTTVLNHKRGVYNSFWTKHTGLNSSRAFGKCSLRDDYT